MGSKCTTCAWLSKDSEFLSEIYLHENQTSVSLQNFPQETDPVSDIIEYSRKYIKEIVKIQAF